VLLPNDTYRKRITPITAVLLATVAYLLTLPSVMWDFTVQEVSHKIVIAAYCMHDKFIYGPQ
jgi:hypothetical protein